MSYRDAAHDSITEALEVETPPLLIPAAILGELAYFLERRVPRGELLALLKDIEIGRFTLDCGERDLSRIGQLIERYADLQLGLVDAAVIACAERNGGRVHTLDLRHFGVVAREGRITVVP